LKPGAQIKTAKSLENALLVQLILGYSTLNWMKSSANVKSVTKESYVDCYDVHLSGVGYTLKKIMIITLLIFSMNKFAKL